MMLFLLVVGHVISVNCLQQNYEKCNSQELVYYKVIFETHWSRLLFPKQYPEWRPPAQWSKLIGRTHNTNHTLFRIGEFSNKGFQLFAESGKTDGLESRNQHGGIFDEFYASPVTSGIGKTETDFFVDGNHSLVSLAARIVPSPDWFVGVDSLQLCNEGNWVDTITVEASPIDAGTDNGFTYTSPNWPSEPQERIFQITSKFPRHPANSFYYPTLPDLPAIATFNIEKTKVYKLKTERIKEMKNEIDITTDDLQVLYQHKQKKVNKSKKGRKKKHRTRNIDKPFVDSPCKVSDWSSWSSCSVSCGIGSTTRTRSIVHPGTRGPCPPLNETKWCGEHKDCRHQFFKWEK